MKVRSHFVGNPVMLAIFWFEQRVGFVAIGKPFGAGVKPKLLVADPITEIGAMHQAGAVVGLLDIGIGQLPRADAVDKVGLVPAIGKHALLLGDELAVGF